MSAWLNAFIVVMLHMAVTTVESNTKVTPKSYGSSSDAIAITTSNVSSQDNKSGCNGYIHDYDIWYNPFNDSTEFLVTNVYANHTSCCEICQQYSNSSYLAIVNETSIGDLHNRLVNDPIWIQHNEQNPNTANCTFILSGYVYTYSNDSDACSYELHCLCQQQSVNESRAINSIHTQSQDTSCWSTTSLHSPWISDNNSYYDYIVTANPVPFSACDSECKQLFHVSIASVQPDVLKMTFFKAVIHRRFWFRVDTDASRNSCYFNYKHFIIKHKDCSFNMTCLCQRQSETYIKTTLRTTTTSNANSPIGQYTSSTFSSGVSTGQSISSTTSSVTATKTTNTPSTTSITSKTSANRLHSFSPVSSTESPVSSLNNSTTMEMLTSELIRLNNPLNSGWMKYRNAEYLVNTQLVSYEEAVRDCDNVNGQLVTSNHPVALMALAKIVFTDGMYWLGGRRDNSCLSAMVDGKVSVTVSNCETEKYSICSRVVDSENVLKEPSFVHLLQDMTVDSKNTSKRERTLISVEDKRQSAKTMGCTLGVACLLVLVGLLLIADLNRVCITLSEKKSANLLKESDA